jgi:hypothetical protein
MAQEEEGVVILVQVPFVLEMAVKGVEERVDI